MSEEYFDRGYQSLQRHFLTSPFAKPLTQGKTIDCPCYCIRWLEASVGIMVLDSFCLLHHGLLRQVEMSSYQIGIIQFMTSFE